MRWPELTLVAASLCAPAVLATEPVLEPFSATYSVEWKGLTAGRATLELERGESDVWIYRSRNVARGLFRLAFPDVITQTSTFRIVGPLVLPLRYRADDGSKRTERDIDLGFDWTRGRITGTAERHEVDVELQPGVVDPMSVQIALMRALAAGREPESFRLIDKSQVKEYLYAREGTPTIDTALGALETIVYRSQRSGSNRITRTWHAPALGFVPVRAEREREGRLEWQMKIRTLEGR